ncbi:MAG: hypothetical protein IT245_08075 [Bacteroidia bacterium]|nr:hypothetical protein [Bacteroidia bacterium]
MKSGNKLNQALKKALQEHPQPLHEAQWERIRAELEEKKRRPFLWLYFFGSALLLLTIGGLVYWNASNNIESVKSISIQPAIENPIVNINVDSTLEVKSDIKHLSQTETEINNSIESKRNTQLQTTQKSLKIDDIPAKSKSLSAANTNRFRRPNPVNDQLLYDIENLKPNSIKSNSLDNLIQNIGASKHVLVESPKVMNDTIEKINDSAQQTPQLTNAIAQNEDGVESDIPTDDSTKSKKKKKKSKVSEKGEYGNGVFVLGLATGITSINTSVVKLTNQEYLHKDTKNVFEAGNKNQSAFFMNFSFEYKLGSLGFRLNSGLQYRSISNDINFNYKLSQIAVRNSDNTISFYINVPDSSNPMVFKLQSRQSFQFITLPLQLSYGLKLNSKYEAIFNAGVNISGLVASSGKMFNLNSFEAKPVNTLMNRKINYGLNGGIQLSRHLYRQWWLGLEAGLSTVNMAYDLGSGNLNSRITSRSLNLQIRFKL